MDLERRNLERKAAAGDATEEQLLHNLRRSGQLSVEGILDVTRDLDLISKFLGKPIPSDDQRLRLAALYNHAGVQGMSFLHYQSGVMDVDEAAVILMVRGGTYFDYLRGPVMKTDVSKSYDNRLYNRDNGEGAYSWALNCSGCRLCNG